MEKEFNVLVIDDDKSIRNLFMRLLSKKYNVIFAENGSIAVDLAAKQSFDIAFIDMRMPGLNGCETFIELRKIQPNFTGIIMTGYADKDLRMEAYLAGTVQYLNKPFDIKEIKELVRHEAYLRKIKQESERKNI